MIRRSRDRVLDNAMKRLLHQFLSGNFGELGAGNFMNGLPHFAAEFSPITDFLDCCRPEVRLLATTTTSAIDRRQPRRIGERSPLAYSPDRNQGSGA